MIARPDLSRRVRRALTRMPAVLLLGPRQCGKTTLARMIAGDRPAATAFDLENPDDRAALEQPMTALRPLRGLVVLDEVQLRPDLFPVLRVLCDRRPLRSRFLILGSASPDLLRQSSESLAGRVEVIEMGGFDLQDVGVDKLEDLWVRGAFPRSYLARTLEASDVWRRDLIQTFVERDIPRMGMSLPALQLRRCWNMVAHYHGQTSNASEIGRSLGVSDHTTRAWLDVLAGAFMVRQLPPWFENLGKRQVKAPKLYVRDSGLLHTLLGVDSYRALLSHPKCGASWEGFALEEVLRILAPREAYFWSVHGQGELGLLAFAGPRRVGFEFKFSDAPATSRFLESAVQDLGLAATYVVYPGQRTYEIRSGIQAVPLAVLRERLGKDGFLPGRR